MQRLRYIEYKRRSGSGSDSLSNYQKCHFKTFKKSSGETFACLKILLKVPFLTGLCKGTVTVSLSRCKKTWLSFCLTITNPGFTRVFITFCPEIIGNSGTYNIHLCNFPENSGLLLCNLKHQFNGFFDVLKCFFLSGHPH